MRNPWLIQPYVTSGFLKAGSTVLTTSSSLPSDPRLQDSRFFKQLLHASKFFKLSDFQELFLHNHPAIGFVNCLSTHPQSIGIYNGPKVLMELGKCIHSSRVCTADSWLGSLSLVIFKFPFIGFLESCSPLLPDYGSSSKKKVKDLQKTATCPSFCNFLKKIHKLSTTPSSQQQPTLPVDQSHHRICGARQGTHKD